MRWDREESVKASGENVLTASAVMPNYFIRCECHCLVHLLPVKAIQRAYLVASRRQCDATSSPQVTVREMMPMMMKKSVVTHSGGSRGGIQVLSRPWMVWHCRTRPTVRAPAERNWMLLNGLIIEWIQAHKTLNIWDYELPVDLKGKWKFVICDIWAIQIKLTWSFKYWQQYNHYSKRLIKSKYCTKSLLSFSRCTPNAECYTEYWF